MLINGARAGTDFYSITLICAAYFTESQPDQRNANKPDLRRLRVVGGGNGEERIV